LMESFKDALSTFAKRFSLIIEKTGKEIPGSEQKKA
jgi:hypothetical protein